MNIYFYDRTCLQFKRIGLKNILIIGSMLLLSTACVTFGLVDKGRVYESVLNVYLHKPNFTEERLISKIKSMNLRFPHIALAQAKLESSYYSSGIFQDNSNLFGMKEARQRPTTCLGTRRGHAYYDTWENSVVDYALWFSAYANKCKTEEQFYTLLATYAKDPTYEKKIKSIIDKQKLKEVF